jgi:hypothetical protein
MKLRIHLLRSPSSEIPFAKIIREFKLFLKERNIKFDYKSWRGSNSIDITIDDFKTIRQELIELDKKCIISFELVYYSFNESIPLLSLVGFSMSRNNKTSEIIRIINHYNNNFSKQAILDCQKALINGGYINNASY